MSPLTGLVIGKFLPPHAGHLYLIARARQQAAQLSVVIFSKAAEPIPGALRLSWLRELLPGCLVYHVAREHPVDYADPDAWRFWVAAIREVLPSDPELVFSSEPYGDELARRLGARHVIVDPERRHVPVSATQIRRDPTAYWKFLPVPVREYYESRPLFAAPPET